jgi:adenylate cyclase
LCQTLNPRQVIALLNTYLGVMADIVVKHHGTVDEFIGDAVLALFGAPIQREDHARCALACAVEMQLAMREVNERNGWQSLPELAMGIGVHSGEVIVGNIGSDRRAKYGVVGSDVNLTSRIQSHSRGGQILASEAAVRAGGEGVRIDGQSEVQLKGLSPLTLYDIGGIGAPYHLSLARPPFPA